MNPNSTPRQLQTFPLCLLVADLPQGAIARDLKILDSSPRAPLGSDSPGHTGSVGSWNQDFRRISRFTLTML